MDLRAVVPQGHVEATVPGVQAPRPVDIERIAVRAVKAAQMLDVSDEWLRRNCVREGIPHARVGGLTLFPIEGLRAWIAARSEVAA